MERTPPPKRRQLGSPVSVASSRHPAQHFSQHSAEQEAQTPAVSVDNSAEQQAAEDTPPFLGSAAIAAQLAHRHGAQDLPIVCSLQPLSTRTLLFVVMPTVWPSPRHEAFLRDVPRFYGVFKLNRFMLPSGYGFLSRFILRTLLLVHSCEDTEGTAKPRL